MQNINLLLPDDIVFEFKSFSNAQATFNAKLQQSLAIGMFVSREISLARAAQLAGKKLIDFVDILKDLGIPAFMYTDDMLVLHGEFFIFKTFIHRQ
jgi:predicted HTH domain antitoxin